MGATMQNAYIISDGGIVAQNYPPAHFFSLPMFTSAAKNSFRNLYAVVVEGPHRTCLTQQTQKQETTPQPAPPLLRSHSLDEAPLRTVLRPSSDSYERPTSSGGMPRRPSFQRTRSVQFEELPRPSQMYGRRVRRQSQSKSTWDRWSALFATGSNLNARRRWP
ncbi:hypothetical protein PENSPDRAFT_311774 [Peniophora sp. CONT]|nr:hypothetical protein PENSPDRAFT_311774 [Peniophora sp. CONT]